MRPHRPPPLFAVLPVLLLVGLTGCDPAPRPGPPPGSPPATTPADPSGTPAPPDDGTALPGTPTRPARPDRDEPVTSFRTAYGWAVPAEPALVRHRVRPPVAAPPAPPLPYLVEIRAADHPEERPGYTRISFYFRGGFPSYELAYLARVPAEGTGEPLRLPGNAFLRIRFVQAQAHDERGRSSVTTAPPPALGFPTLRGYAFGGDFEGYLTYGLGLRVAPGSDQALPVRALELVRTDGRYVVAVDVRRS
ncbi:AMIN-like domain-containing (lipo)protein [Plantactinospora endophytica]|uniref:AMIN-like domain-containing protein n=1 Tax=Plantactinospora endophytica TaxID=673535 RepID=A0ABQ4E0W1_9ACTN|nr:hypothetical protein [Plantactinospora endophytica]GIG88305.1 hypothetical protein Pen02_32410 [Plantactinospora endophytica]